MTTATPDGGENPIAGLMRGRIATTPLRAHWGWLLVLGIVQVLGGRMRVLTLMLAALFMADGAVRVLLWGIAFEDRAWSRHAARARLACDRAVEVGASARDQSRNGWWSELRVGAGLSPQEACGGYFLARAQLACTRVICRAYFLCRKQTCSDRLGGGNQSGAAAEW